MMTPDQLKLYWANLNSVYRAQVGTVAPRGPLGNVGSTDPVAPSAQDKDEFRKQFHAQHNLPPSTKDFTKTHMDQFLAACAAILQPANLKPQLRAFDQEKTRLLHKINQQQAPQLKALGIPDPLAYIAKVSKDKFRGRLPVDLSQSHHSIHGSYYSELEKLRNTIARTISELRQQKGWTVHELLWNAGLQKTCQCAQCKRVGTVPARQGPPRGPLPTRELATDNAPF